MDILAQILKDKKTEVDEKKSLYPVKLLEKSSFFQTEPVSLKKYLLRKDKSGIIAEFKTKSPSKGDINPYADIKKISISYMQAGASALSVLTDKTYFGGSSENLTLARKYNYCPILQKDFFIDEYQVIEAKSIGADAILLIASVLSIPKLKSMAKLASSLGLEVLFEIHTVDELQKLNEFIEIVGVNNRNLKTFETNIVHSIEIVREVPDELVKVSESGIHTVFDIIKLSSSGFQGFLIGEKFMSSGDPGKACQEFISDLNRQIEEAKTKGLN